MSKPRWRLSHLLLIVATAGIAFGVHRSFWQPSPDPNARLHLAAYLALLATATLGSVFARPMWRRPCQGYALFGWLNLVCVLWGGFGLVTYTDATRIVEGSRMGAAFGVLCGVVAAWFLEPPDGDE